MDLAAALNAQAQQAAVAQQQTRTISVPVELPVPGLFNLGDMQVMMKYLNAGPRAEVNMLCTRIEALVNAAVQEFINPTPTTPVATEQGEIQGQNATGNAAATDKRPNLPPGVEPVQVGPEVAGLIFPLVRAKDYAAARDCLDLAENSRRSGDGTLDVSPAADPSEDYAACTTLISQAMHHLDEALPNGQRIRTLSAYAALEYGTRALGAYLKPRLSAGSL